MGDGDCGLELLQVYRRQESELGRRDWELAGRQKRGEYRKQAGNKEGVMGNSRPTSKKSDPPQGQIPLTPFTAIVKDGPRFPST